MTAVSMRSARATNSSKVALVADPGLRFSLLRIGRPKGDDHVRPKADRSFHGLFVGAHASSEALVHVRHLDDMARLLTSLDDNVLYLVFTLALCPWTAPIYDRLGRSTRPVKIESFYELALTVRALCLTCKAFLGVVDKDLWRHAFRLAKPRVQATWALTSNDWAGYHFWKRQVRRARAAANPHLPGMQDTLRGPAWAAPLTEKVLKL